MFDFIFSGTFGFWLVISIVAVVIILGTFYQISQETRGVIERFGKFHKISKPGLGLKIPFVDQITYRPSLRTIELEVPVETITADKVTVHLHIAIQFLIGGEGNSSLEEAVKLAVYKLSDPTQQMTSYIQDEVIAEVPRMELDEVFSKKEEIGQNVKNKLDIAMRPFGFVVVRSLVNKIVIDAKVETSMNAINAAKRDRVAATEKGEADKILTIKAAEAQKEKKRLDGEGIAEQRMAVANGFATSIEDIVKATDGKIGEQEVMAVLQMIQFYDTLNQLGDSPANTILMPFTPGANTDFTQQMITANSVFSNTGTQEEKS